MKIIFMNIRAWALNKISYMKMSKKSFNKKIFLFYIILFNQILLVSCGPNIKKDEINDWNKKNDWNEYELKGKVSSIKERHYLAKMEFGNIVKSSNDIYFGDSVLFNSSWVHLGVSSGIGVSFEQNKDVYFTRNGFLSEERWIDEKGISNIEFYFYDDKNRLLKEYGSDSIVKTDEENVWYIKTSIDSIVYKGKEGYQYHRDKSKPQFYLSVLSKYDDNDNVVEEIGYSPAKEIVNRRVFKYDFQGRIVSDITYSRESISDKYEYKYLENEKRITYNDKSTTIEIYYDSAYKKLKARTSVDIDGSLKKETFKYDSLGNVISYERNDWNNNEPYCQINAFNYVYDKNGNWIKRVGIEKFGQELIPIGITEREINYHQDINAIPSSNNNLN